MAPLDPIPSGRRRHIVGVQNPGATVPDGDGGWTVTPAAGISWQVAIEPATARDLERIAGGTVIAQASHVVIGPYRSDITVNSALTFESRTLQIKSVMDPEERHRELRCVCVELLP